MCFGKITCLPVHTAYFITCCLWQVISSPFGPYFPKCKMKGLVKWSLRSLPTLNVYCMNKELGSQTVFDSIQGIKFCIWQMLIKHLLSAGPLLGTENTVLNKTSTFLALVELMVWSFNIRKHSTYFRKSQKASLRKCPLSRFEG